VARIQFNQQRIERRSVLGMWLLVAFTSALLSVACLSPTLPLPPPSRPDVSAPDEDGNIRISGVVQSRAGVFAHNQRTDEVVGEMTGADGVYDLIMQAQVGDRIAVWQSVNTKESASTEVVVPAVTIDNDTPADPDAMGGTTGE
jgi:hypothetical protein